MLQDEAPHRPARGRPAALVAMPLAALFAALVLAAPATADVCDAASDRAADAHGVPRAVMRAVLRVETGLGRGAARRGWPWSANADGRSHRFETRDEALAFARSPAARRAGNVDWGCFQVSERWHGENFSGVAHMLDPAANAAYAARLLSGHHAETGDWTRAVGRYHSRTEAHAGPYRARFRTELAALGPEAGATPPRAPITQPARPAVVAGGGQAFTRVAGLGARPAVPERVAAPAAAAPVRAPAQALDAPEVRRADGRPAPLTGSASPLVRVRAPGAAVPGGSLAAGAAWNPAGPLVGRARPLGAGS